MDAPVTLSVERFDAIAKLGRWLTGAGSGFDDGAVLLEPVVAGGQGLTAGDLRRIAGIIEGTTEEGSASMHDVDADDGQVVVLARLADWICEGGWSAVENEVVLGGMDPVSIEELKAIARQRETLMQCLPDPPTPP